MGDPLFHFMFILINEGLHVAIKDAIGEGMFKGAHAHGLHFNFHTFFMRMM